MPTGRRQGPLDFCYSLFISMSAPKLAQACVYCNRKKVRSCGFPLRLNSTPIDEDSRSNVTFPPGTALAGHAKTRELSARVLSHFPKNNPTGN